MSRREVKTRAELWRTMARTGLDTAEAVFIRSDYRGCVNRAYYAAYHAATSVCVLHEDEFPHGWNNPAHDQLPDLIEMNGDLSLDARRRIARHLNYLRYARETADYRPGLTVDRKLAQECLHRAAAVLGLCGARNDDD